MQAVKSTNICEIVHFFRLHDLQVTAQQKIKILSLVSRLGNLILFRVLVNSFVLIYIDTEDFQFPFEKNPLKVLLSIIHDTQSIIQKAVDEKEAELTKELKGDDIIVYNIIYNNYPNIVIMIIHEIQQLIIN